MPAISGWFEGLQSGERLYYCLDVSDEAIATATSIIFYLHGIDESFDTPGAHKLCEVFGASKHLVIGIEYHRHGRSSCRHGQKGDLPSVNIVLDELFDMIKELTTPESSILIPRHLKELPFAICGHSFGGALSIVLGHRIINNQSFKERLLGIVLLAPAVDTLIDPSLNDYHCCNCCFPPKDTHCFSIVHPLYCGLVYCLYRAATCCPKLILPMDDPTVGNDGYLKRVEAEMYRDSPHNIIDHMKIGGIKAILELMKLIQSQYWGNSRGEAKISKPAYFMLYGSSDRIVPPRSMKSFAVANGMTRVGVEEGFVAGSTSDTSRGLMLTGINESFYVCLEDSTHQVLGFREKYIGSNTIVDEIKCDILPMVSRWLDVRMQAINK